MTLLSQMGSACSAASAAVSPEQKSIQVQGQDVTRYSSSPATTVLESGLLQGSDTRDAKPASSGRRNSLPVQSSRSAENAGEINPKAGLESHIRRLSSNPVPPQSLVPHKDLSGAYDVIRPDTGRMGLAQPAIPTPRSATSEDGRAKLEADARASRSNPEPRTLNPEP